MSEITSIPEEISERKNVVYKSRIDPTIVKLTAEKMKYTLFKSGHPIRKSEDIRVISVDKYYESYILIEANYRIKYFKKKVYTLNVDPETEEVKISGELYKPEIDRNSSGEQLKVVHLEAEMWSSYQDKICLMFNKEGQEISPEQVPVAPSEEHPEKMLKEFNKTGSPKGSPQKEIEIVRTRIVKRPQDAIKIENELFQVSEHTIIYTPIYEITFRNIKTGEEKLIKIDGVTAKIVS